MAKRINPAQAGAWASLSHLYNNDPTTTSTHVLDAAQRAYEADAFLSNASTIVERLFYAAYDLGQELDAAHWCTEGYRRFPGESAFTICQIYLMTMRGNEPQVDRAWQLAGSPAISAKGRVDFQKATARMWVAAVLARAGLKDSARAVARSAVANTDVDPARLLYYFQAIALNMLDDKPAAIQAIKTFLAANPERRREFADPNWYFRSLAGEQALRAIVGTSGR